MEEEDAATTRESSRKRHRGPVARAPGLAVKSGPPAIPRTGEKEAVPCKRFKKIEVGIPSVVAYFVFSNGSL